jgi:hypothetical protein
MAGDNSLNVEMSAESRMALAEQVKHFPAKLKAELKAKLEGIGGDAANAIRQAILVSPGGGSGRQWRGHPHSSRAIAAEAVSSAAAHPLGAEGVSVGVIGNGMGPGRQAFPFVLNRSATLHPVFGKQNTPWVSQRGDPYMDQIMVKFRLRAETDVSAALAEAAESVKGSRS